MFDLPPGRILALDWGEVRIGIATSDVGRSLASPFDTIPAKPREEAVRKIVRLVDEYDVTLILVGLPLNMDGSEGKSAEKARAFAEEIKLATGKPVECIDERLSSFSAEQALRALGRKPSKDKGRVDRTAAALILQEYLDGLSRSGF